MSCSMMLLKLLWTTGPQKMIQTFGNVALEDDIKIQINVFFCEIQSFHPNLKVFFKELVWFVVLIFLSVFYKKRINLF